MSEDREGPETAVDEELRAFMDDVPESPHYQAHPTEVGYQIIALLVRGYSLRAIAAQPGMPSETLISEWGSGDYSSGAAGVVSRHYAQARTAQGEFLASEASRMVRELADGICDATGDELPDDATRRFGTALDSLRWMLPKLAAPNWSDKLGIHHNSQVNLKQIAAEQERRESSVLGQARRRVYTESDLEEPTPGFSLDE